MGKKEQRLQLMPFQVHQPWSQHIKHRQETINVQGKEGEQKK